MFSSLATHSEVRNTSSLSISAFSRRSAAIMSGDREAIRPPAATTAVLPSKCRRDPQQVGFALPEAVECSEAATSSPGERTARMRAGRF